MRKNAILLNGGDKTRLYDVACDQGEVSLYENLLKSHAGSSYLDRLNKCFYVKMGDTGSFDDWKLLSGTPGKKCAVFVAEPNDFRLGVLASSLQTGVKISDDDKVTGVLHKINGFTGFSNIESEQSGHYLCIHIPLSKDPEVRKTQSLFATVGSRDEKKLNPKEEGSYLVARITPEDKKIVITIKIEGDAEGAKTSTRTLDLSGLFLENV